MAAEIDIVVPTIRGREESLERCIESYKRHSIVPTNEIIVKDSRSSGWGWKKGLRMSRAPYVLLAADDHECISPKWAQTCIETADAGKIVCPRVWQPNGGIESQGGDMNAFAHIINRPQKDWTQVDYTTIPFLSREAIDEIGMLEIHYSSDTWVSYRGRQLGYETVLRHGFDIRHWQHPVGRGAGMEQVERDHQDEKILQKELNQLAAEPMLWVKPRV
jgi:hypothetical protein